jgi:predicted N-acyltransferase
VSRPGFTTRLKADLAERKQLRGPSELQFAIADRIGFLDAASWDRVTQGQSVFLSRAYLAMLESARPENLEPRYALICRDGVPVAAVFMQIVSVTPDRLRKRSDDAQRSSVRRVLSKLTTPLRATLNEAARQRIVVCGNLLSYGFHGVAFAEGEDRAPLWHAVTEVLYRVRRAEKLAGQTSFVIVKDLTAGELKTSQPLGKLSYQKVDTEPDMVLSVQPGWKKYDDYLGSLASKYRSAVKQQIFKPIEAAGCVVEQLSDVDAWGDRLHALYLQVHTNASMRPVTLPDGYFPALARFGGERMRYAVVKRGDELLGFLVTLKDNETAIAYHIGFDREAAEGLPIYLRLLHAGIGDAIDMGCKRISFGRTALEPKARLGAKPEALSVWVRHRQPVLNALVRDLLGGIHHDEAPERNPFKTAASADQSGA